MKKQDELIGYVVGYLDKNNTVVYIKYDGLELSEVEVSSSLKEAIKFTTFEEAQEWAMKYVDNQMIDLDRVKCKRFFIEEVVLKSYVADTVDFCK